MGPLVLSVVGSLRESTKRGRRVEPRQVWVPAGRGSRNISPEPWRRAERWSPKGLSFRTEGGPGHSGPRRRRRQGRRLIPPPTRGVVPPVGSGSAPFAAGGGGGRGADGGGRRRETCGRGGVELRLYFLWAPMPPLRGKTWAELVRMCPYTRGLARRLRAPLECAGGPRPLLTPSHRHRKG